MRDIFISCFLLLLLCLLIKNFNYFILLLSLIKIYECFFHVFWLFKNGIEYRNIFFTCIDQENKLLDCELAEKVAKDYKYPEPYFLNTLNKLRKQRNLLKVITFITQKFIYRQPALVIWLSLGIFLNIVPGEILRFQCVLIFLLILSALINLLYSRLSLGFVDNFRWDFFHNVPENFHKNNHLKIWTKADFIYRFIVGVGIFFYSSLFGFSAIFYTFYKLDENSFNCPNKLCSWFDFVYFSMITSTTVGYGDIYPTSIGAKTLIIFEIIFSISTLTILLFALSNTFTSEEK